MTNQTIFANAQVVLPNEAFIGQVVIQGGIVTGISRARTVPTGGAIDCTGDLLMPGLVELHTDNLERHIQPRPKVDWPPHAAAIVAHDAELASVGITTVFDAMRVGSIPKGGAARYDAYARDLSWELLELRKQGGALRISHYLHLRAEVCSQTLVAELNEFGPPEDRVGIVSLMDHTPGQRQFRDMEKLASYVMGKHSMTPPAEFDDHVARLRKLRDTYGDDHEAAAVTEARRFGAVLASHDDTTADHVMTSRSYGIGLAEFPTTVEAARACRDHDIKVMMGAPI